MLKYPLVFVFNVLEEQFGAFGFSLFNHLRLIFEQDNQNCIFMPIRNSKFTHIEGRAEKIHKKLLKIGPAHVIAASVSGLDCRIASSYLSTPMKTLFTISSPHHGSALADYAVSEERRLNKFEPILKVLGLPYYGFAELQTGKIKSLNKLYPNCATPIVSTSSWRLKKDISEVFMQSSTVLQGSEESPVHKWSDGVFYVKEMKWGDHLLSFDGDHSHIFGSDLKVNCAPIYRLAIDNAIRFEKNEEGKVAIFR